MRFPASPFFSLRGIPPREGQEPPGRSRRAKNPGLENQYENPCTVTLISLILVDPDPPLVFDEGSLSAQRLHVSYLCGSGQSTFPPRDKITDTCCQRNTEHTRTLVMKVVLCRSDMLVRWFLATAICTTPTRVPGCHWPPGTLDAQWKAQPA